MLAQGYVLKCAPDSPIDVLSFLLNLTNCCCCIWQSQLVVGSNSRSISSHQPNRTSTSFTQDASRPRKIAQYISTGSSSDRPDLELIYRFGGPLYVPGIAFPRVCKVTPGALNLGCAGNTTAVFFPMGTVSLKIGEGTAKVRNGGWCVGSPILNLVIVISVFVTNSLALYSFYISQQLNGAGTSLAKATGYSNRSNPSRAMEAVANIRSQIAAAQRQLTEMKDQLKALRSFEPPPSQSGVPGELRAYLEVRKLPLGRHPTLGIVKIASSVGHPCAIYAAELLGRYMNYSAGKLCPDDGHIAQILMLRGCEPLPRRRCLARSPPECREPPPFPTSLWSTFSDKTIRWTHYTCKSFECLNARKRTGKAFEDCVDCFDIRSGPERRRWVTARDRHDFLIDDVLGSNPGAVRIGLDIGGGGGTFAARMAERNVTIVTTTLDLNGPFNKFVALRGLLPLHLTVGQRFPFFDNTMDIVHTMHVLSNWMPLETLDFLLFDIDRILRPGGLFWLDRFFCAEDELEKIYVPLIEKFSYKKMKWVTGRKADSVGKLRREVYLSALLQKPPRG